MTIAVDFAGNDMDLISNCAQYQGMDVPEFIHYSVMDYVNRQQEEVPNATTLEAFAEGERLLQDKNALRFTNIDDLFADLNS